MRALHLKQIGDTWHYQRRRPTEYADIEPGSLIRFSLKTSGLFETKDAELGFLMMALCAIVGDAYRNIIHGYQLRPKSA